MTDFSIKLGKHGERVEGIDDIIQSIYLILSTPLGSDPHRPDFGSAIPSYIDMPVNIARPKIIAEAVRAIEKWEERVEVTQIEIEQGDPEQLMVTCEFIVKDTGEKKIAEVPL